jgi:hypothetical protein
MQYSRLFWATGPLPQSGEPLKIRNSPGSLRA